MVNSPEKLPKIDAALQHRFEQGHLIGELAKKWFPEGIDIPSENFKENLELSKALLLKRKSMFEAGYVSEQTYARADILRPSGKDKWDIIEVKTIADADKKNYS